MKGQDLGPARVQLGAAWGLLRPLSRAELGRVLGLQGRDVGATISDLERKPTKDLTGPMALAIQLMLDGARPADLYARLERPDLAELADR